MTTDTNIRADVYDRITAQIVTAIEEGAPRFEMPWHRAASAGAPINAITNKAYRGINTVALWVAAQVNGYQSDRWATYRAWDQLGCQVRGGEKSTCAVFFKDLRQDQGEAEQTDDERRPRFVAKAYNVFCADQVDGYEVPAVPAELPQAARIARAEAWFDGLRTGAGLRVTEQGDKAFYRPATDEIIVPPFPAFRSAEAFYSVLSHEVTHWTGHESRLDRKLANRFGSEAYAVEELVAELGAAFLAADLSLGLEPKAENAAYIQGWLKVLKADKRAIFTAATAAQRAADWLHGQADRTEEMAA